MAGSRLTIAGAREGKSAPTNGASRTIAGNVYDQIRADILACRIEPGAKVKINDFTVQFGVSLGAVREALSKLSSDGLVIAEAQKGFTVAPISHGELVDLTKTRIEIESLCLLDSIKHGDFEWESHVIGALHLLSRLDEREARDKARLSDAWVEAHSEFHESLVSACQSPIKLRIRKALYEQSERYRRLSVPVRVAERDVHAEHQAIVDAAVRRDAKRATMLMAEHITRTMDILLGASFPVSKSAQKTRSGRNEQGARKPPVKRTIRNA